MKQHMLYFKTGKVQQTSLFLSAASKITSRLWFSLRQVLKHVNKNLHKSEKCKAVKLRWSYRQAWLAWVSRWACCTSWPSRTLKKIAKGLLVKIPRVDHFLHKTSFSKMPASLGLSLVVLHSGIPCLKVYHTWNLTVTRAAQQQFLDNTVQAHVNTMIYY